MLVNPECHIWVEMGTKGVGPWAASMGERVKWRVSRDVSERVVSRSGWFTYGFTPSASSGLLVLSTSSVGMALTALDACSHHTPTSTLPSLRTKYLYNPRPRTPLPTL